MAYCTNSSTLCWIPKDFHFLLNSKPKKVAMPILQRQFFYWTQHTVSLLSDPEEATWVSVGKLGHSFRRKESADRFTLEGFKYRVKSGSIIGTNKGLFTLPNMIAWWSRLNKITRARFFETPRSYETPSKPFFTSQHGLKFSPRNGREISSITRNEFKTRLDFSFNIQSGF